MFELTYAFPESKVLKGLDQELVILSQDNKIQGSKMESNIKSGFSSLDSLHGLVSEGEKTAE